MTISASADADGFPVRETWVASDCGRLYAKSWNGEARALPPFVLFHDSLGCVDLWREFPQRLAAASGRTVIAYDRLGFGKSDPYPGRLGFGFVADEGRQTLPALRAHFAFERCIALGHSVGGGMAIECASRFPMWCAALITESAQTFVEDRTLAGIRDAQRTFAQPGQLERLARYHGDKAAWVLSAWIDTWLDPAFADWNLDAALARVQCPTLALHGENEEFGSSRHPERIAALVKGPVTMQLLRNIGHVPHREAEDVVIGLIVKFLASAQDVAGK